MKSPYSLIPIVFGITAIVATPFQSAIALNATEVSAIAEAVTVRIDGQNPGSGVIIKRQANVYTVLTTAHVVETEDGYDAVTPDGQVHKIEYSKVKKLPNVDLALVEFTSSNSYKVAEMGDSTSVKVGESIYVSGFPVPTAAITESILNFSEGKVTAKAQRPLADGYALVYSNDTLPGMSGGAVLDGQGKLIAIHGRADAEQAIQKTEVVYEKTGFNLGIPINTFLNVAANVSPNLGFVSKTTEATGSEITADDWFLQAGDKFRKGNYQGAIKDYDQAIAINPKYTEAYNSRGHIYNELKQYQEAIKDLDQAIAINPKYAIAYSNRGRAYIELKQYQKAIKDLNQAIAINPKDAIAYINRGNAYFHLKQYQKAIKDFDQSIAIDSKHAKAYNNRGWTYFHLKQYQKAIKDYDQAIAINPKYAIAYSNRGLTYIELKQYPQAIKDVNQAIAIDPKHAEAYSNRGDAYLYLKQYQKAIKDYDQAIAINPNLADSYNNRGVTYFELKQYQKAIKDFDQSIAIDPKHAKAYNNRGYTYRELKQYQKAIKDFDQAIAINPKDAEAYYNRGNTYRYLGDNTQAKENFQEAVQLSQQQNNPEIYQRSIQLLQSL